MPRISSSETAALVAIGVSVANWFMRQLSIHASGRAVGATSLGGAIRCPPTMIRSAAHGPRLLFVLMNRRPVVEHVIGHAR
jgi:hypothetical protein